VRNVPWTLQDALDKAEGKPGLIYQREALALLARHVRDLHKAHDEVCAEMEGWKEEAGNAEELRAEVERLKARRYDSNEHALEVSDLTETCQQLTTQLRELREAAQAFHAWVYKSWGKHEPVERFGAVLAKGGA
jgi:predicted RNase H-like nuclease (RuvC/YqgF family)